MTLSSSASALAHKVKSVIARLTGVFALICAGFAIAVIPGKVSFEYPPDEGSLQVKKTIDLRVMSFNIEWGGALISFDSVVEAIRLVNADIVGIQEAEGNLARLAGELGWHYNLRNYVISKYPLVEPPDSDGRYVYVEVSPGKIVALANVHLPSDPYGPDVLRDGGTLEEAIEVERRVRLPKMLPYLEVLPALVSSGIPVFITGDFNAPSHADWTDDVVGSRPVLNYAVNWPVSIAIETAGFKDSWRTAHPDARKNPGLTWWAARPPLKDYTPTEEDAPDRIDFLWFAGPVTLKSSDIVGEKNGPEVSFSVEPWPSDHRAVISSFTVSPVTMPPLVAVEHRVNRRGDHLQLKYHTNDLSTLQLLQVTDAVTVKVAERNVSGTGSAEFSSDKLETGHYYAVLISPAHKPLKTEFWVQERDERPSIIAREIKLKVGQAINVDWSGGPGNRNDYIAAYKHDVITGYDNGLAWVYTKAKPEGHAVIDESTSEWGWPLQPGKYVVRLIKDDGYEALAESEMFVVE